MTKRLSILLIGVFAVLCSNITVSCSLSEPSVVFPTKVDTSILTKYDFLKLEENFITDPNNTLEPLFQNLTVLHEINSYCHEDQETDSLPQIVPILQIGDSHIQAGFMSQIVRKSFHIDFGNAGRGFITPLRMAGTNEPSDYKITSKENWDNSKCVQRSAPDNIGLGGIAVSTDNKKFSLTIQTLIKDPDFDYSFNKIVAFHDSKAPWLRENEYFSTDTYCSDTTKPYLTEIYLTQSTDSLELEGRVIDSKFSTSRYFGFSLENGRDGVLFHSIGVNGACYQHYSKQKLFLEQTADLNPQLIILSLGTNEAASPRFNEEIFYNEMKSLVSELRKVNPAAAIILMVPAENYRRSGRSYVVNDNIEKVRDVIARFSKDSGVAYWDMFNVTGGVGSAKKWKGNSLFARDNIHFTAQGYAVQGELLYNAIINSYRHYLTQKTAKNK